MQRFLGALGAIAICTSLAMAASEASSPVDFMDLHQVEITFHTAASTKNVDMMMSLFADDATLSAGGRSWVGKDQVRSYFTNVAGSFQPQNVWVAYTPAHRIKFNVNGNRATLYFECLYVDPDTDAVVVKRALFGTVKKVNGDWMFWHMEGGVATL